MTRAWFIIAWILVGCCAAFGAAPIVWVVPSSLLRVYPMDAPGSGTTVTINCARGEYCAFQVAVQAPASGLTNVSLSVSNLTGPGGATIPSTNLILYRESYMTMTAGQHSPFPGYVTPGLPFTSDNGVQNAPITSINTFPDALIPAIDPATGTPPTAGATFAFALPTLAAGNNVVFWIDTFVPRGTAPGAYTGTYTVASSQESVQGAIQLTVWNFTLPLQPSLKSIIGGGDNNVNNGTALAAGIQAELLRNRLMPDTRTLANGTNNDISQYGLNELDFGYFENVSFGHCNRTKPAPPTLAALQSTVNAQPTGLYFADYTADPESGCTNTSYYNSVIAFAQVFHQAVVTGVPGQVGVDNIVSQRPDPAAIAGGLLNDGLGTGRSAVDVWTMLPQDYDVAQTSTTGGVPNVTFVQQKGDKVWSYNDEVLDLYSPKWELDFPPINYRIQLGFISQSLGLKGMNYWAVSKWASSSSAWTSPASAGSPFPDEGILVYPGGPAGLESTTSYQGVAPSMRLKYLRDGVQDYEYVQLLKSSACNQTTFAQQTMLALSSSGSEDPNWHDWTMNQATLESARLTLGNQLSSLGCAP